MTMITAFLFIILHTNGGQQASEEKFNIYKDQLDISLMGLKADIAKVEAKVEEISEHEAKDFRELNAKFERVEEQRAKSLMETIAELLDDLPKGALEGERLQITDEPKPVIRQEMQSLGKNQQVSGSGKHVMYYTFYSSGMEEFVKINDCASYVHLERYEMKSITRTDYRKENWTFIQDEKRKHWMQMARELNPDGINVFADADIVFLKDPTAAVQEFCSNNVSILMATDVYMDKELMSGGFVILCSLQDPISEEWAGPMNDNKYDREQLFIDHLEKTYPKNIVRLPGDVVVGGMNLGKATSENAFAFHTNWCEDMKCKQEKLRQVIFDITKKQSLIDCYDMVQSASME